MLNLHVKSSDKRLLAQYARNTAEIAASSPRLSRKHRVIFSFFDICNPQMVKIGMTACAKSDIADHPVSTNQSSEL